MITAKDTFVYYKFIIYFRRGIYYNYNDGLVINNRNQTHQQQKNKMDVAVAVFFFFFSVY